MIRPAGHRILVMPEVVDEKEGSIWLAPETRKHMGDAQIYGKVVSLGTNAFKAFDDGDPWCREGDRVAFAKYGGFNIMDPKDKKLYRLLNDEDICAVITED
jgi:co-chaperonin GroES (HSP10)